MASFKVTPNLNNGHDLPPLSSAVVKAVENGTSTSVAKSYAQWRDKYVRRFEGMLYVAYNDDGTNLPKDAVTVSEAIGCGRVCAERVARIRAALWILTRSTARALSVYMQSASESE